MRAPRGLKWGLMSPSSSLYLNLSLHSKRNGPIQCRRVIRSLANLTRLPQLLLRLWVGLAMWSLHRHRHLLSLAIGAAVACPLFQARRLALLQVC